MMLHTFAKLTFVLLFSQNLPKDSKIGVDPFLISICKSSFFLLQCLFDLHDISKVRQFSSPKEKLNRYSVSYSLHNIRSHHPNFTRRPVTYKSHMFLLE